MNRPSSNRRASESRPSERDAVRRLAAVLSALSRACAVAPALVSVLLLGSALTACGPQKAPDDAASEAHEAAPDETAAAEPAPKPTPEYAAEIEVFRQEVKTELLKEDSWLTLAGLYWLEEGESTFGSADDNDVIFPEKAPAHLGTFVRDGKEVRVRAEPGAGLVHDGKPVTEISLAADAAGEPVVLSVGSLDFFAIERPGMVGIRLKDREHPNLANFEGVEAFPTDPSWRIEARFEPYDPPKDVRIPNVLGTEFEDVSPGALVFERDGQTWRLDPVGDPEQGLFLVFGDATNGEETYGGGRFLSIPPPEGGTAIVDFNRATNPPCVYTPYATCPLPPRQNKLRGLRVEAGEKMWGDGVHEKGGPAAAGDAHGDAHGEE